MNWIEVQLIIYCEEEQFPEIIEYIESKAKRYNLNILNASYRSIWYRTTEDKEELFLKAITKKYSDIEFKDFPMKIPDPNEEPEE